MRPDRSHGQKLFCENENCARRIFTEPLPGIAARYARKTCRLADALLELVLLVGGEAAARIAKTFGLLVSPDALLWAAHRVPEEAISTPRVLGVDDFAFRKGQSYGTILIDHERRQPVDLLPDREAATLEAWLRVHPDIQIITRDRSTAYTDAITKAMPQAQQVADRWHLVKNLAEALTRLLDQHRSQIHQAAPLLAAISNTPPVVWPPSKGAPPEEHRQGQRQKRQARADLVFALHQKGMSQRKICRLLGLARPTVRRIVAAGGMVERAPPPVRPSSLDPFKPHLHQRWKEGCRNASQLHREIQAMGFAGTASWVLRYVRGLRLGAAMEGTGRSVRPPSSRRVAALMVRRVEKRSEPVSLEEKAFLNALCQSSPSIQKANDLAQEFLLMVHLRQGERLEEWISAARSSEVSLLAGFAKGLMLDLYAVRAGLTVEWSNGAVEGQVNRLKFLKRQGYGRAGFVLLRARVLHRSAA